ncbi:helix-turn-helix transcriptional regulator [Saccharothrix sp. BKS2]|uniref:helix-turn-helix domain-containing protein n=1 Tax=Saccharothrix sp. BKS2 TaxID=3064400 RepID=UPI0039EBF9F5
MNTDMTEPRDVPPPQPRTASAHSRELGEELRRARSGASARQLAGRLGWSIPKIAKLEAGTRGITEWDAASLLTACGTDQDTLTRIRRLLSLDVHAYLRLHGDAASDELAGVAVHERLAVRVQCYEPLRVPPLLQTAGYVRAQATEGVSTPVDRAVRARMARQKVLNKFSTPTWVFYLRQAVLETEFGGLAEAHEQAVHLEMLSRRDDVTVRVLPNLVDGHPALAHGVSLAVLPQPSTPVAYVELDVATAFIDDETAVRAYQEKFEVLDRLALDARQSRWLIAQRASVCMNRLAGEAESDSPAPRD